MAVMTLPPNWSQVVSPANESPHRESTVVNNRERLIKRIGELVESAKLLRIELEHYERTMTGIAERLRLGDPAISASDDTEIPTQRRQVTEAIQEFEAARHQLRLSLFVVGREEGASISRIGRVLGISRQLASRIAREAVDKEG
jgi:hypothetical protein